MSELPGFREPGPPIPFRTIGHYAIRVAGQPHDAYQVTDEELAIPIASSPPVDRYFRVDAEGLRTNEYALSLDRAESYLATAAGQQAFREFADGIRRARFYNIQPSVMREIQVPGPGDLLEPDGRNVADVLARLSREAPALHKRIEQYLQVIVPGLIGLGVRDLGPRRTAEFRMDGAQASVPTRFLAASMSDGTLRALGVLVALFQGDEENRLSLVGIEEPESALHPAAAGVLRDALRDAATHRQVLVTSHSPDLLDDPDLPSGGDDRNPREAVLAVEARGGSTVVGPLDAAGRHALREALYTPGELLRIGQLVPEPVRPDSSSLFAL